MFGREMRLPLDAIMGSPLGQTPKAYPDMLLWNNIKVNEQLARNHLNASQINQK